MSSEYEPKEYWEKRLSSHDGLRATGHISFSENYNAWLYRAKRRALERALKNVPLRNKNVLDVGCGNGYFVNWYIKQGANVDGVDIVEPGIEALRRRYRGDFRVLDISAPQVDPVGEYEIVNVWDVLYHIVDDVGFDRALRFVAGNLRAGGLLLVTDRLGAPADSRIAEHVRMRCLETYQAVLQRLGFEFVGLQFLFGWLNRYVSIPAIDSQLGRLFYLLDGGASSPRADNLSLGVWRRIAKS